MYASYFGLRELPFNNTPDPRFFFSTPDHEEALASLIYAAGQRKGFVLLTGEVGSGKTLVTRLMLKHLGDSIAFASINNTHLSPDELLLHICTEFNILTPANASNAELTRRLQDFLVANFAADRPVVLMLDEAQALSREAFEQVRMIGNLEADDAKLLQIVIVGQPELRERFEANDMRQLRQRIFRSFHLAALNREQTSGYIHHRLAVAGAQHVGDTFDPPAIDAIHEYSQGLPRLINTVCDNAMLSAYAADRRHIDREMIDGVIYQMMSIPQGGPKYASPRVAPIESESHRATGVNLCTHCGQPHEDRGYKTCPSCTLHLREEVQRLRYGKPSAASDMETALATVAEADAMAQIRARQLHELIQSAREVFNQNRSVVDETRQVTQSASQVRDAARQATARLAEQAAKTGRLSVALRKVFAQIERRAVDLMNRAVEGDSHARIAAGDEPTRNLLERTRTVERSLRMNRTAVDEVKSLITATTDAQPVEDIKPDAQRSTGPGDATVTLAEQVRALNKLIDQSRHAALRAQVSR